MIFRQLFDRESCTYTYIVADEQSREGVIIDPVFEHHRRDLALIRELDLKLLWCLDTHCHADHVTGAWLIRGATACRYGLAAVNKAQGVDEELKDGDRLPFGAGTVEAVATPGHTNGCLSFKIDAGKMIFTGDALLIRGTGRTDFQSGSARELFHSIRSRLFTLDDDYQVWPGHDYSGRCMSTIGEEKAFNPRLGGNANENDYVRLMENLNLPHPKKIAEALPANLKSGRPAFTSEEEPRWAPLVFTYAGIPQVDPEWVATRAGSVQIVDVRDPAELNGGLSAIPDAVNIPLHELRERAGELDAARPTVLICRSGRRSAQGVNMLKQLGFGQVANIKDGMLAWNELTLPTVAPVDRDASM